MKKKINETDKDIVFKELKVLYNICPKIKCISNCQWPSSFEKNDKLIIGKPQGKINSSNYADRFIEYSENSLYFIQMVDNSFINFYYEFDNEGNMTMHNVSFVPAPKSEDDLYPGITENDYLRFDYDEIGRKEYVHTLIHLHKSVSESNFRLPVSHKVFPNEMVYIVCKYLYLDDSDILEKLTFDYKNKDVLSQKEKNRLYLSFGPYVDL